LVHPLHTHAGAFFWEKIPSEVVEKRRLSDGAVKVTRWDGEGGTG
jgi:hypothetical protein